MYVQWKKDTHGGEEKCPDVRDLIIHEMLREKERQGNTTTERQSNTTQLAQGSYFSKKKLPWVGFEPTTVRLLGVALTNWATEAAQLAGLESHIQYKATKAPQASQTT